MLPFTQYATDLRSASDGSLILPLQIMHGGGLRQGSQLKSPPTETNALCAGCVDHSEQGLSSDATNEATIWTRTAISGSADSAALIGSGGSI